MRSAIQHQQATDDRRPTTLVEAEAHTRRLTYGHYENFPVASWLMPKALRQHVCNIYAFARSADDFADEAEFSGQRMARLEEWRKWLHEAAVAAHEAGRGTRDEERGARSEEDDGIRTTDDGRRMPPIFVALAESIRAQQLPIALLNDLITAFMLDAKKARYQQFGEVMHYCRHSANPIGRLVLHLFGYGNEQWMTLSDHICTALQLANFWQDVAVDLEKNDGEGRIYLPQDEMARYGVAEEQLFARQSSPQLRELMQFQCERTRAIFQQGRELCDIVPHKRLKWELRLTWLGGMEILRKIEANDFDIFRRPVVTKRDWVRLLWQSYHW